MGTEPVVVNASPLIALLGIRQEGLLPAPFGEVYAPGPPKTQTWLD